MTENNENELSKTSNKKDNNPLSVRVDPYYKEVFENLIKKKKVPKKVLLETMISSYVDVGNESERESNISFSNEINLIAGNLNEIMSIFKTMTTKSQDTVGSQKSFYEQKIKNLETKLKMFENSNIEISEKFKLLELAYNNINSDKEKLEKKTKNLDEIEVISERKISVYIRKNAELLEQINSLRKIEKENALLNGKLEKIINENKILKTSLEDKIFESDRLKKIKISMEESMNEIKNRKEEEFKELELLIRKEADIDKKMEILHLQIKYNKLQAENIKNLEIINKKSKEISRLKLKI
ncbi:MAG: hypothetical protein ABF289_13965 [Clostridiales bacterium]